MYCQTDSHSTWQPDFLSEDAFQELQNEFMEKHYQHFEDVEENKLIYTDIFTQYVSTILAVNLNSPMLVAQT